jgi:hypothetical protein
MYMRLWRRIFGEPKFRRVTFSDCQVRKSLGVPSLDCIIRRRRLTYLARLVKSDVSQLRAMLQVKGHDGSRLPWVRLIVRDFQVLCSSLPRIFEHMPDPVLHPDSFCVLAHDFPCEWKRIISLYCQYEDDGDFVRGIKRSLFVESPSIPLPVLDFVCRDCHPFSFLANKKAVDQHKRRMHGTRCPVDAFLGDVTICPICATDYHSRVRLVTHLSETKVRSKTRGTSCNAAFLLSQPARVADEVLNVLHARDTEPRIAAVKAGHTHVIAARPCTRGKPSILKKG